MKWSPSQSMFSAMLSLTELVLKTNDGLVRISSKVVNFVYVKWVFLVAVFFERDYGFEIVPVGFYVFLNLFFNLRYPLLVNCRSSRFLKISPISLLSKRWKYKHWLYFRWLDIWIVSHQLFYLFWSGFLLFRYNRIGVCPVMINSDCFSLLTQVPPRVTWNKDTFKTTSFTYLFPPSLLSNWVVFITPYCVLKGQHSLVHLKQLQQSV